MTRTSLARLLLATTLLTACSHTPEQQAPQSMLPQADGSNRLIPVAGFDHQVTGVAVSEQGRIFINFPRWTDDAPISVGELVQGSVIAYPNDEWNRWRNTNKDQVDPATHFVCVQAVFADHQGHLWVIDPAAPGNDKVVKHGPKLVKIDLATNSVSRVYAFNDQVAPTASYLNDVRISPDGAHAYLTDSGKGAIVVLDLNSGQARRLLDGDRSTQAEKGVTAMADGRPLKRPDGRQPEFASDGIALTPDGGTLYYQALTGKTLYRIDTASLLDPALSPQALSARVQKAGENGVADGLWIDEHNRLYVSDPADNAVKLRADPAKPGDAPKTIVSDPRLRWPDTFAEGPDGSIYVTASHIQDSPWFKPDAPQSVMTSLWRIVPTQK